MNTKLIIAVAIFGLVAVPAFAQSGSRGSAPSPSIFGSAPVVGSATRTAPALPRPSFAPAQASPGTSILPSQPVFSSGSGSRNVVPLQSSSTPSNQVFSQGAVFQPSPSFCGSSCGVSTFHSGCGGSSIPVQSFRRFNNPWARRSFGCGF